MVAAIGHERRAVEARNAVAGLLIAGLDYMQAMRAAPARLVGG
jgi:hypothetical protein